MIHVGMDRDESLIVNMNTRVERSIFVRQPVVVTECNQWSQFQQDSASSLIGHTVLDNRRVPAVNHEYGFFQRHSINKKCEVRKQVEPEPLQIAVTLWMNR